MNRRNQHNQYIRLFISMLLSILPVSSFALSSDKYAPYHIRAKEIQYSKQPHQVRYIEHAHATQGSTTLSGDLIVSYFRPNSNQIYKLTATGKPAHYSTLPNNEKVRLYAEADTIIYYPLKNQVLLLKNARVTEKQNVFTGQHIWYDMNTKRVVSTSPNKGDMTRIVIVPSKKHSKS